MKKAFAILTAAVLVLYGCHNQNAGHEGHEAYVHEEEHHEGHSHEGHDHEGHDHSSHNHEGHTHGEAETHEEHDHSSHNHEGHDHGSEGHEAHADNGEISLCSHLQETFGVTTDTVKVGDFSEIIRTSGRISSANGDEFTITAKCDGIVGMERLVEGSAVGKGANIATISSKGLPSGDILTKVTIAYETAKKEYERDLRLNKDNIVSESHLDQSRLAYEQAKAEYDALTSEGFSQDGVTVQSPVAGYIKNLKVSNGDFVQTGQVIATVSRNRRLQLIADLPERYYSLAGEIKDANFITSGKDNVFNIKQLNGRLLSYGRTSDSDYYIPVTMEFDNVGDIVPGAFVDVYLKTAGSAHSLSVPTGAIMEEEGTSYVFVQKDSETFVKRIVKLGQSDGERVRVISGLHEGERVVATGTVQVKLAAYKAVPAGHSHSH